MMNDDDDEAIPRVEGGANDNTGVSGVRCTRNRTVPV